MEQKRTLWIIAAVGVFLLVVLGAALMLYAPAAKPAQSVASSRGMDNGTASNGWISLAPSAPSQGKPYDYDANEDAYNFEGEASETMGTEFRTDEVNIYAETANVYSETTNMNGLGKNPQTVINTTTIDLNGSSTPNVAVKSEPVPPAAVTKPAEKAVAKAPAQVKPVETKAVAKAPAKTVTQKATPVKQTVAAKTTSTVQSKPAITQYWIQVTALTSRKSADAAREVLGQNQITADVFTYTDAKNQLFYRVRVGPYTTKSEAEYWRTKIAKIDNFKSTASYVTSTKVE